MTRLTTMNMRAAARRAQVPVMANRPKDGMSMTSMKTKRLNRSAVSNAPHAPASSMRVSAGKKRVEVSPMESANQQAAKTTTAVLSSMTAVRVSATSGIEMPPTKPPMLSANTVSPVPAWDQER